LRLGETRVPIDGIKARIASSPIDVRVAILDSCKSGAFSRTKGARKAPAFEIQADSARDAKGVVILTSSTSDEDSQESDAIGGSYFSHHLASGLLGGADRSGDGRVTLFEAYAYAYDRTVADTAESAAGAQHPTFSYDLAGNGDLVLTDVAVRHEGIYIPREAPSGVYFLVDGKGFVAAEISKADGLDRRVALSPGRYRVKRRLPDRLRVGEIDVPQGRMVALAEGQLRDAPFSDDPVKGAGRVDLTSRWSLGAGATTNPSSQRRAAPACSHRPACWPSTCRCETFCARTGSGASTSRWDGRTASSPASARRSSSARCRWGRRCWSSGRAPP